MGTACAASALVGKRVISAHGTPSPREDKNSALLTQEKGLEVVMIRFLSCI